MNGRERIGKGILTSDHPDLTDKREGKGRNCFSLSSPPIDVIRCFIYKPIINHPDETDENKLDKFSKQANMGSRVSRNRKISYRQVGELALHF